MKKLSMLILGMIVMGVTLAGFGVYNDSIFHGRVILEGTGIAYDDLTVPGYGFKGGATPPDLVNYTGQSGTTGIQLYCFDGGATLELVMFQMQMPHRWKVGSDLSPHIHWTKVDNNAGNVKRNITCDRVNIGDPIGVNFSALSITGYGGSGWYHKMSIFPDMTGTTKTISSMLSCILFRNPSDVGDTYNSDACVLQFDWHYQIDSFGSDAQGSKSF